MLIIITDSISVAIQFESVLILQMFVDVFIQAARISHVLSTKTSARVLTDKIFSSSLSAGSGHYRIR